MLHLLLLATLSLALTQTTTAASPAQWRNRTIYQVMTDRFATTSGSTTAPCDTAERLYCGGTFQGLQAKLDYIQGMGFDAVWISPVTAQLRGNTTYGYAYHGYWQTDLYAINPHFGTAAELQALSAALHARGMYLMVDVVVNHNGAKGQVQDIDYGMYSPFDKEEYFHPYCLIDFDDPYNATNIEDCWFSGAPVPLPDLRTEWAPVATGYQKWIKELVSNYSIDGLRLDTVFEVDTGFWSGFRTAADDIYMVGEVDLSNSSWVCSYQAYLPGVLNYGTYFPLVSAFSSTSGDMLSLAQTIDAVKAECSDTSLLGTFSENQDQPRFAFLTPDWSLAKNVVAFTLLADGIPIVYEGQEQHYAAVGSSNGNDPYNREAVWLSGYNTNATLYRLIAQLNAARRQAIADDSGYLTYRNWPIYNDTTTLAMRKGNMVTVLSNKGAEGASYSQSIPAGYAAGTQVTELLTCATLAADAEGGIEVPMAQGLPRVYYPTAGLAGSGICGAAGSKLAARAGAEEHLRRHRLEVRHS